MTTEKRAGLRVITNTNIKTESIPEEHNKEYLTNPMYQKLLNFTLLQEKQKKRFSVDDLFKLC